MFIQTDKGRQISRQTGSKAEKQSSRQVDREIYRKTDKQTQTDRYSRQTGKQIDIQKNRRHKFLQRDRRKNNLKQNSEHPKQVYALTGRQTGRLHKQKN